MPEEGLDVRATAASSDGIGRATLWSDQLSRLHGLAASPCGSTRTDQVCAPHTLAERASPLRFLIHDRDNKLTEALDELFRTEGISIIRTPVRAPKANAFAERFVGTVRRECLDWMLTFSRRQLERTLRTYVEQYSGRLRPRQRRNPAGGRGCSAGRDYSLRHRPRSRSRRQRSRPRPTGASDR
jgi:hypothetical protein